MRPLLLLAAAIAAASPSPDGASPVSAAASPLLPSLCVREGQAEADRQPDLRCAGLVGTDIFLRGEANAPSLALGRPEGFLDPPCPGARLGQSINWRLIESRPIAAIVRYRAACGTGNETVLLAVLKPPAGQRAGCLVAVLEEANGVNGVEAAARLAYRSAPPFRCAADRPALEGPFSDGARRIAAAWVDRAAAR